MDTKELAKLLGSNGGKATMRLHGKQHYTTIGKQGARKRWDGKRLLSSPPANEPSGFGCTKCELARPMHPRYTGHEFSLKVK